MQIKYYNTNFDNIKNTKSADKKIFEIISKLAALNIIFDQNLLGNTIKIAKKFEINKKKNNCFWNRWFKFRCQSSR